MKRFATDDVTEGISQKGGVGQEPSTTRPLPPMGQVLTEGNTKSNVKRQEDNGRSPIAPPPPPRVSSVVYHGTVKAVCDLTDHGFRTEGYIMRDELGNCALAHAGRVVRITNDELDDLFDPKSEDRFGDEEEG